MKSALGKKTGSTSVSVVKTKKALHFLDEASADNKFILTTRIRAIGNSKGVILNNQFISSAGLNPDEEVNIIAKKGMIIITQAKSSVINTDLSTWDSQFKSAIKKGVQPEGDLFEGMVNEFDKKEW